LHRLWKVKQWPAAYSDEKGLAMSILLSLMLLQATTAVAPGAAQTASAPPDDAKIVCKTIQPTGSRLGGERICLAKREWRRLHESGKEATRELQDTYSKQGANQ
jgi:hypothetical protein